MERHAHTIDKVRRIVDADYSPGQFYLAGSAGEDADTHSGAGRIVTIRMRPPFLRRDDVPAWQPGLSHFVPLLHQPKRHLADPALAAVLLGVTAEKLLSGAPSHIPEQWPTAEGMASASCR